MLKIITAYNTKYKSLINITQDITKNYCDYHGFAFEAYEIPENYARPNAWAKIQYLITNIEQNEYKYILWLDADTIINNPKYDIVSVITPHKYIYLSKDHHDINTGVWLLKNNSYNRDMLYKIWDMTEYMDHAWWEQAAFIDLVDNNWNNITDFIQYIPSKAFNGYMAPITDDPTYHADESTFILHLPGSTMEFRHHQLMNKKLTHEYQQIKHLNIKAIKLLDRFIESYAETKSLAVQHNNTSISELCDLMLFRFVQEIRS
jgi:hypothetical protein